MIGKCSINPITNPKPIYSHSKIMTIWTLFLVLVCGTHAQSLFAPFSHTLYMSNEFPYKKKRRDILLKSNAEAVAQCVGSNVHTEFSKANLFEMQCTTAISESVL
jgi:hypothetical protein